VNPTVCIVMGHLNSSSIVLLNIISEQCSFSICSLGGDLICAFGDVTKVAEH
jgi:hypothetical protein